MQKIIIKNFRQISYAEIEIRKLVFLIGEQASGKSTIAKLVYFFKDLRYVISNILGEKDFEDLDKMIKFTIFQEFKKFWNNNDFDFYIKFDYPSSWSITIEQNEDRLDISIEGLDFKSINKNILNNLYNVDWMDNRIDGNLVMANFEIKTNILDNVFKDNFPFSFFPAGRNITVAYNEQFQAQFLGSIYNDNSSNDMVLMKNFIFHSKKIIDRMRKYRENNKNLPENLNYFVEKHYNYILKGKYSDGGSDNGEKIIIKNNKSIPLREASSGQQEVIRILQDLSYILYSEEKSFRIIEEPEAHLYPMAQKKLIELFSLVANKTDSQFMITTHSPYILSILNNLLMYTNVLRNNPDAAAEMKNHFGTQNLNGEDERINILPEDIQIYAVSLGDEVYCHSVIDAETGLIGENYLDAVTEELNNDFDVLYQLNFQNA